jgi:DNA-binding NtrC family response regulator
MLDYAWPGNIRELQHVIERACILTPGETLSASDLFEGNLPSSVSEDSSEPDLSQYLQSCERRYITNTLDLHRWQMGDTAAALGISRKNLWEKMKKLGIKAEQEQTQSGQ